ncbi:hypothetical protein [uncultured Nocardioides sp.]|nr:hypothetical protein [uncultured Nocardioides sp.]
MNPGVDNRPVMQWIEVADARGGTRLEARWFVPAEVVPVAQVAAA